MWFDAESSHLSIGDFLADGAHPDTGPANRDTDGAGSRGALLPHSRLSSRLAKRLLDFCPGHRCKRGGFTLVKGTSVAAPVNDAID